MTSTTGHISPSRQRCLRVKECYTQNRLGAYLRKYGGSITEEGSLVVIGRQSKIVYVRSRRHDATLSLPQERL